MKFLVIFGSIIPDAGGFNIPLYLLLILILVVIVLLVIERFFKSELNPDKFKREMNTLLVLGSMSAALGMLGQIMGIWYALAAILAAADISPAIVIEGLQASFGPTYLGFIIFFIAFFAWLIFNYVPTKTAASNK